MTHLDIWVRTSDCDREYQEMGFYHTACQCMMRRRPLADYSTIAIEGTLYCMMRRVRLCLSINHNWNRGHHLLTNDRTTPNQQFVTARNLGNTKAHEPIAEHLIARSPTQWVPFPAAWNPWYTRVHWATLILIFQYIHFQLLGWGEVTRTWL